MKKALVIATIILHTIYGTAQEKEFIVKKNFDDVMSLVTDFQSKLSPNENQAAGMDEKNFITSLKVNDELYSKDTESNYLNIKFKTKAIKATISSVWTVNVDKINKKSTKISLKLLQVLPKSTSKKDVDITKTISSGKLEKELKDYLENDSPGKKSIDPADVATEAVSAAVSVDPENADFLKNVLDQNKVIPLPNSVANLTKKLNSSPSIDKNELCEKGEYYIWNFDSGVNLIYARLKTKSQYTSIAYFGNEKISGLPLDLIFNETAFGECKSKFAKYSPKTHQETEKVSDTESRAFNVMEFKMNQYYVQLGFYNNEYVTSIQVSNAKM